MEIVLTYQNELLSLITPYTGNTARDLRKSLETNQMSFRLVFTNEKEHGSPESYHTLAN